MQRVAHDAVSVVRVCHKIGDAGVHHAAGEGRVQVLRRHESCMSAEHIAPALDDRQHGTTESWPCFWRSPYAGHCHA